MGAFKRLSRFLRLPVNYPVHPQVRHHFRRNFIFNALDGIFWLFGESFVSVNTILPVFMATLTDSAVLIGLVPALIQAGWFLPQLLLAGHVRRLPRKMPFARVMAVTERIPYLALPLTAYLLNWVSPEIVLWIFVVAVAWRGLTSGMIALPWQEVIASVIPMPVRSRFFGISRMVGRTMGVIGSAIAGVVLTEVAYPDNYALTFLIGAGLIGVSYFFFSRTVEPDPSEEALSAEEDLKKQPLLDLPAFKTILQNDHNFRKYLLSRIFLQMGGMASGFLAVYGVRQFALPEAQAAVFSGLLFASGILGFAVWGVFGDHTGPKTVLMTSDLMQISLLVIAYFARSVWIYYAVFLIFGFAQSGYVVGDMVMGMELGPETERTFYIGLVRSIPGIFVLAAPLVGGVLVEWVGYKVMFLVAIAFSALGLTLLASFKGRQKVDNSVDFA